MSNKLRQFQSLLNEGISQEDLADSLMNRLQMRYPDILDKYGYDAVEDAVNDVASFHAGAEELGSSDISIMLKQIIKALESSSSEVSEAEDWRNPSPEALKQIALGWAKKHPNIDQEIAAAEKEYDPYYEMSSGVAWSRGKQVADHLQYLKQVKAIIDKGLNQGVTEADKHSFIGKLQRHHELKKKVDQTWKDAADAEKRGDTKGANRAFNKHVRYTNLERPGTWRDVKEQGVAEGQLSNFEIAYKTKDGNSFTVVSASSKDEAIAKFKQKYPSARATSIRGTGRSPIKEEGVEEAYDDFRNKERTHGEHEPAGLFTVMLNGKDWIVGSSNEMFTAAERVARKYPMKKVQVRWPNGAINTVGGQVNELSTNKLAQYKTAASKDASAADKAGDFKRGDKRFAGIVKATKKQFDNDAKQVKESSIMKGLRNVK